MRTDKPSIFRPRWKLPLIILAAFIFTVILFYGEETWRGRRALEHVKGRMAAHGESLDWSKQIPPEVPKDQNFFGAPHMQEWFTDHGQTALSKKLIFPADTNRPRMMEARFASGTKDHLPGPDWTALDWTAPNVKQAVAQKIIDAFGGIAQDPAGGFYVKQIPNPFHSPQIFLISPTNVPDWVLKNFASQDLECINVNDFVRVEKTGDGIYERRILQPVLATDYLAWRKTMQPDFDLIQTALERPYARMNGDYSHPAYIPIPNFVTMRAVAQRLAASSECFWLTGHPDEGVAEVRLLNRLCAAVLEKNKPMTLVSAMVNVAIRGLQAGSIGRAISLRELPEPQWAELESEFFGMNILTNVQTATLGESSSYCYYLSHGSVRSFFNLFPNRETKAWEQFRENVFITLLPHGWLYLNMETSQDIRDRLSQAINADAELVYPTKVDAAMVRNSTELQSWSPGTFLVAIGLPNYSRAFKTSTKNQTMLNQMVVALALERYRLVHHEYPDDLFALVPKYIEGIPHDVIGGLAPHYRRNADGTFLLYSIGWDEKDHDGDPRFDYVWQEE